jgi:hypothetical protein
MKATVERCVQMETVQILPMKEYAPGCTEAMMSGKPFGIPKTLENYAPG